MNLPPWTASTIFIALGYFVSLVVGQLVTAWITKYLWKIAEEEAKVVQKTEKPIRTSPIIARWHGVAERFVYTSMVLLGKPEGIAVWLAFKAVMRWKVYDDDARHIPGSAIYVVGTIVSLTFGVIGGMIATRKMGL
jgi:uncharacterized protein YneF (UPF0154 family)